MMIWHRSSWLPPSTHLLIPITMAVLIGALVPAAARSSALPFDIAALLAASAVAAIIASIRWPAITVVAYWMLYSFASTFSLTHQVGMGGVPVTLTDGIVAVMAIACTIRLPAVRWGLDLFGAAVLVVALLALTSVGLGILHAHLTYAVLIDLRTIAYLLVGTLAGYTLVNPLVNRKRLEVLFGAAGLGFLVEQAMTTLSGLSSVLSHGGGFQDYRDIDVSHFTGKYGLFQVTSWALHGTLSPRVTMPMLGVLLGVTAASLIRTAWVASAAGLLGLLAIPGARHRWMVAVSLISLCGLGVGALTYLPALSIVSAAVGARVGEFVSPQAGQIDTVALRLAESQIALSSLQSPIDWLLGAGMGLVVGNDGLHPTQHNSFVWLISKMGVVGAAAFLWAYIVIPGYLGVRAILRSSVWRPLLGTLLAAHVANTVSGYLSGNITYWEYAPIFGMTVAWIVRLAQAVRVGNARTNQHWVS